MANYTAADVKKLRELTGAGMMDCKKALDEAEGNVEKAVEALRIKGQKGVAKREGRSAENGAVVSIIADDNSSGVLVELKCETDFVAKGEKFQAVAAAIAEHVAKTSPADLEALLASEIEAGKTVQAFVDEANANLGEKIVLDRFAQYADGYVTAYMHRTMPDLPPQIGVLVELDKPNAEVDVWNILVTNDKMSDAMAYNIVKTLFEKKSELVAVHKEAQNIELKSQSVGSPIPFHPGAKKYFAEQGVKVN